MVVILAAVLWASPTLAQARGKSTAGNYKTWYMHFGPGMVFGGGTRFGVDARLSTKIVESAPVYAGVDLGVYLTMSPFTMMFPITPALYYKFYGNAHIIPTLGVALGPVIGVGGGNTAVEIALLFKPAMEFTVGNQTEFYFEPKLGLIGSTFVFMPNVGLIFRM